MQEGSQTLPRLDPTSFDTKQCTLIIVNIGFSRNLGCDIKFEEKTKKYPPPLGGPQKVLGTGEVH